MTIYFNYFPSTRVEFEKKWEVKKEKEWRSVRQTMAFKVSILKMLDDKEIKTGRAFCRRVLRVK